MGVVFLAEQQEPVRRLVALKIIKQGMDSGQIVARFESERQALALMDHPNIAKVAARPVGRCLTKARNRPSALKTPPGTWDFNKSGSPTSRWPVSHSRACRGSFRSTSG